VKLLFDHNLSHRLLHALQNEYPGSQHVRNVGLAQASDEAVWQYAAQHGLNIITKDADFHQRSFLFGHPPKVVWIRCGNCSTATIEQLLRLRRNDLIQFTADRAGAFLVIE
jgi:predicted nuclease of predicted toxin-antitoxin system